jgi:hypothetical protein
VVLYGWSLNGVDDSSHASPAGPDAPDVGDFVIGFLAETAFGWDMNFL